jgi:hypothetical protein
MATLSIRSTEVSNGPSRRQVLAAGAAAAAAVGGVALSRRPSLAGQAKSARSSSFGSAKHVIHIYLHGGAPTQDMWDLKPAAPAEIRGEFKPIATSASGIAICEHLPKTANWMHKAAIVRSVHHKTGCHNCLPSFTGSEQPVDINEPVPRETYPPGMGAVCEYLKAAEIELPHYVALPTWLGWGFLLKRPGPWGGFLGSRCDPLQSSYEPVQNKEVPQDRQPVWVGAPKLAAAELPKDMSLDRLGGRRELLSSLNADSTAGGDKAESVSRNWRKAYGLLSEPQLKAAFDLSKETDKVRETYGSHLWGSSALVARRLIETGVRFVDLYFDGYSYRVNTGFDTYWDTHSKNFEQLKKGNLPMFDQAFDALVGDLDSRGLLDETLIVVSSDFGRTPRVNSNAGRDHWTDCYSVLFTGAGIRGGTLCGASDAHAAYVKDRPTRPADICATIFHLLGIDPEMTVTDRVGRPIPVANGGEAIGEILG